jgi:TonB family protein
MGYQALLFCPDEKTARAVTQVLSELDFAVVPCTEPFAAVKRLMSEHFDAVVVDCDNEQNATLLFKSARNAPNNHSSLAVAVVEGQAGVAKAFRIGANLVLTKPVNVEQAKGTLRVARGLLRKSEAAKLATGAASAAAKFATPQRAVPTVSAAGVAASIAAAAASSGIPRADEIASPAMVASAAKSAGSQPEISSPIVEHLPRPGTFGMGAASAPAPARELKSDTATAPATVVSAPEIPVGKVIASGSTSSAAEASAGASSLTLGGNVGSESAGGRSKKLVLAVAVAVLLAAVGYAVWMQWVVSGGGLSPFTHAVAQLVTTAAKVPQTAAKPAAIVPPASVASSAPSSTATKPEAETHATVSSESASGAASRVADNKAPDASETGRASAGKNHSAQPSARLSAQPSVQPGVGKSGAGGEVTAPSIAGIASAGSSSSLPNLMNSSKAPTPVLQELHVSQGVSRGLLVKEIAPVYPASALRMHVEGAVELLATISKSGDISGVKVVSGDSRLTHAAVDAVKQWKYKPYLLNGEPFEIQTQVTVKFKAPR